MSEEENAPIPQNNTTDTSPVRTIFKIGLTEAGIIAIIAIIVGGVFFYFGVIHLPEPFSSHSSLPHTPTHSPSLQPTSPIAHPFYPTPTISNPTILPNNPDSITISGSINGTVASVSASNIIVSNNGADISYTITKNTRIVGPYSPPSGNKTISPAPTSTLIVSSPFTPSAFQSGDTIYLTFDSHHNVLVIQKK